MEQNHLGKQKVLVLNFKTPVYAHAFKLAREFVQKWQELHKGEITEEQWLGFWESRKDVDVIQWL